MMKKAVVAVLILAGGCGASDKALTGDDTGDERLPLSAEASLIVPDPDLVSVPVVLPEPELVNEWPQAGRGPDNVLPHARAAGDFEIAWIVDVAWATGKWPIVPSPVIAGGMIFLMDARPSVHALDMSGNVQWSRRLQALDDDRSRAIGGALAVAGTHLLVSSGYRHVTALDTRTGTEVWTTRTESPVTGAAVIRGDRAYITSSNNEIYALDTGNGNIVWSDQGITETARVLASPSPVVGEDLLVVPFSSGELIGYLPVNGRRLWLDALTVTGRYSPVSALNDIAGRPVLHQGVVYAVSQSGILAAIDALSGIRRWAIEFRSIASPVIGGDFLFVMGLDGRLACFRSSDGKIAWVRQLRRRRDKGTSRNKKIPITWSSPILASGRLVVVSSDGILLGLSPQTGEFVARLDLGRRVATEPVVAGDYLYAVATDGALIAVR